MSNAGYQSQRNRQQEQKQDNSHSKQFAKDEGEYVNYEEVKDDE